MKILVLDNYDSFTYNLLQILTQYVSPDDLQVIKNDEIELDEVVRFDKILLSPGAGIPQEAGKMCELIRTFAPIKSILGICLGHQAIAEVFGGQIVNLAYPFYGLKHQLNICEPKEVLFQTLPISFEVGLYHAWAVVPETLPDCLQVTAMSQKKIVMAITHKTWDVKGLQFHPESMMTPYGATILANWLKSSDR